MTIRAEGTAEAALIAAVYEAFAVIAQVHDRLSFQSPASDLSAIGRLGAGEACRINPLSAACLGEALRLAEDSDGVFDPVLPATGACWRDLSLDGETIAVRRPLRLDLSGIAKGFAVDRACAVLQAAGVGSGLVNAGGDLRAFGQAELVALRPHHDAPPAAVLIEDAALASSDVAGAVAEYGRSCHRNGRDGTPLDAGFVSVVAPRCVDADGLAKIVLVLDEAAAPILASRDALAYRHDPGGCWQTIGSTQ